MILLIAKSRDALRVVAVCDAVWKPVDTRSPDTLAPKRPPTFDRETLVIPLEARTFMSNLSSFALRTNPVHLPVRAAIPWPPLEYAPHL